MRQWKVRHFILKAVSDADSGIVEKTRRWYPDHPGANMNISSVVGDDFWNDPFPEENLSRKRVDFFQRPGFLTGSTNDGPVSVVLRLSSAIRERLREQLTNDN